ncbi:MAG: hypothetical protein HY531_02190 [Chloroflexi bacterium]|nr:hypothetical protein [Chloroflexota bacterium]
MAQERAPRQWLPRALTVVLYLQAAVAVFVGVASMAGLSGFAHTIEDGRRLGAGFLAYALILLAVVIPRFKGDRRIFVVPLAWTAFHLVDSLYELLAAGDTTFIPPVIIEAALLAVFVAGYRALSRQ